MYYLMAEMTYYCIIGSDIIEMKYPIYWRIITCGCGSETGQPAGNAWPAGGGVTITAWPNQKLDAANDADLAKLASSYYWFNDIVIVLTIIEAINYWYIDLTGPNYWYDTAIMTDCGDWWLLLKWLIDWFIITVLILILLLLLLTAIDNTMMTMYD